MSPLNMKGAPSDLNVTYPRVYEMIAIAKSAGLSSLFSTFASFFEVRTYRRREIP